MRALPDGGEQELAQQQADQRGFARARGPGDADARTGRQREGDSLERGSLGIVGEGNIFKRDLAARTRNRLGVGPLHDIGRLVEQFKDPLGADQRSLEARRAFAHRLERRVEQREVTHHQNQITKRDETGLDLPCAQEEHGRRARRDGHRDDDAEAAALQRQAELLLEIAPRMGVT